MSNSPRILLIESDLAALGYLSAMVGREGYEALTAGSGKEGLIEAWRHRPEMIVLDPAQPDLDGLELVRKLRADARTAETKIVLLGERADPQFILAGMQAGANEYIVKRPGADAELMQKIEALVPRAAAPTQEHTPRGTLVCFLSAKGGTGTSSLCANMAHLIGQIVEPQSVAVVDLVLPIGSIGQIVGTQAGTTVVEVSQREPEQITPSQVKELLARTEPWKFHLLPGSADPESAQALSVSRLERIFEALRQAFDYVLVDFGRALSRVSLPFIRSSARVVLVLSSDAATVALSETMLRYLDLQGVRRNQIYPVLNRAVGLEGMSRAEMEKALALNIPSIVPHMGGAFTLANNQHLPLAVKFPNDTATFVLHDLCVGLLDQVGEAVVPPAAT